MRSAAWCVAGRAPPPTSGARGRQDRHAELFKDAWFCGFVPQLAACAWIGHARAEIPMAWVAGFAEVVGGSVPARSGDTFMEPAVAPLSARPLPTPNQSQLVVRRPEAALGAMDHSSPSLKLTAIRSRGSVRVASAALQSELVGGSSSPVSERGHRRQRRTRSPPPPRAADARPRRTTRAARSRGRRHRMSRSRRSPRDPRTTAHGLEKDPCDGRHRDAGQQVTDPSRRRRQQRTR